MPRIARLLAAYGHYHRDARNRRTHFVGVPLIVLALLMFAAAGHLRLAGITIGVDRLLLGALLAYYLWLDWRLACALVLLLGALAALAEYAVRLDAHGALVLAGILFVVGWAFQLLGHRLEGNRPALLDNLAQVFIAPLYLTAEAAFACRWRPKLERQVHDVLLTL